MPRKRAAKKLRITYVKSSIGYSQQQKNTVRALGLTKLGQAVQHDDTPVLRGMLDKVRHLVQIEDDEA